jgi:hypothetical protein
MIRLLKLAILSLTACRLHALDWGGAGPALILVHG